MTKRLRQYSRHRRARALLAAAMLAGLCACTSTAFRSSVGQFATLTKAGVTAQNTRLAAIAAADQERIRTDLANNAVDLRLSRACAQSATSQSLGPLPPCQLVRADGAPLDQPVPIGNIVALSTALSVYADNLIAVAADSTADRAAFTASINNLGTSLGKLEGEVREATSAPPGNSRPEIGAVAAVVAEAGGLYLDYRRSRALREIVLQADPIVQQAVATLVQVQVRIRQYDRGALSAQMEQAQLRAGQAVLALRAARLTNPQAPATDLRNAQNALYALIATYNATGSEVAKYQAIGEAHAALAQAARAGASPEQMAAAITAIMHLAGTIHDSVETLSGDSGSN